MVFTQDSVFQVRFCCYSYFLAHHGSRSNASDLKGMAQQVKARPAELSFHFSVLLSAKDHNRGIGHHSAERVSSRGVEDDGLLVIVDAVQDWVGWHDHRKGRKVVCAGQYQTEVRTYIAKATRHAEASQGERQRTLRGRRVAEASDQNRQVPRQAVEADNHCLSEPRQRSRRQAADTKAADAAGREGGVGSSCTDEGGSEASSRCQSGTGQARRQQWYITFASSVAPPCRQQAVTS